MELNFRRLKAIIDWVDQGWGNEKGQIRIELKRNRNLIASDIPFGTCAHVESQRAKVYDAEKLDYSCNWSPPSNLLQQAKDGDVLEFWRIVGGGGGHQLFINRFHLILEFPN